MTQSIILAIIGSGALSSVISFLLARLTRHDNRDKALTFLLLGELKRLGKEYIALGEVDIEDLQAYNELYETYKALGGNGYADTLKAKVNGLKIKVEE